MSTLVADKALPSALSLAVRYAAGWPQNCNLLAHRGQDRGVWTPILTAARRPAFPGLDQVSILGNFGSRSYVATVTVSHEREALPNFGIRGKEGWES
jgi:hypothetical protein